MKIVIKTLTGHSIPLEVESDLTIRELKNRLYEKEGFSADSQKIIFAGKQLQDTDTLSGSGVAKDSILHCIWTAMEQEPAKKMEKQLSFPVKVMYLREDSETEIRRFRWEGKPDIDRLFSLFESFFGVKNHNRFVLQYQLEGEDVTFSTTIEFVHLVELKRKELNPLKLDLKLKPKSPVSEEKKAAAKPEKPEEKKVKKPEEKKLIKPETSSEKKVIKTETSPEKKAIKPEEKKIIKPEASSEKKVIKAETSPEKKAIKPEEKKIIKPEASSEKKVEKPEEKKVKKTEEKKVIKTETSPSEKKAQKPEEKKVKQVNNNNKESESQSSLGARYHDRLIRIATAGIKQFIGVDTNGNVSVSSATEALDSRTLWKVQMVKDSTKMICLESAAKPNGHLRIGPEGDVTANGGTGKWARFSVAYENGMYCFQGVGNKVFLSVKQGAVVSSDLAEGNSFHILPEMD